MVVEGGTAVCSTRIPITVLTGFTGCGKTTLILHLIPQLRAQNPGYKLAMIKNEIGDVAVDSQLATSAEVAATQELLGDCICCVNIGQVGEALEKLDRETHPDRIIIETSGSAEPLKLVLEIKRLSEATGRYELDGVVSVIDAENWGGYASKSFTARLQAKQTDMIVINKWESLSESDYDTFLDRLGDLDVDTPQVKSDRGWIAKDLLFGLDPMLARTWLHGAEHSHTERHEQGQDHHHSHTSEVECLSITLPAPSRNPNARIDLQTLDALLRAAPKDEVYRIKGLLRCTHGAPKNPDGSTASGGRNSNSIEGRSQWILNWAFGRWTWSSYGADEGDADADDNDEGKAVAAATANVVPAPPPLLRMSIFTAPYESTKWSKKVRDFVKLADGIASHLEVKRVQ